VVNAYSRCAFSLQKARFGAFSPGNLRFKNPVKYNLMTKINFTRAGTAAPPDLLFPEYSSRNRLLERLKLR
jgi:hypothetical protein